MASSIMSNSYTWIILNFPENIFEGNHESSSSHFSIERCTFRLRMCKESVSLGGRLAVYLQQIRSFPERETAVFFCILAIRNKFGVEHYAIRTAHDFNKSQSLVAPIPDAEDLFRTRLLDNFPDRTVHVYSEIRRDNPGQVFHRISQPVEREIIQREEFINKLTADFASLYLEEKYHDLYIITTDQQRIPAHKPIVAARSSYFAERLDPRTREIHVDCDGTNMKKILNFMYSGRIPGSSLDYIKLYGAATSFGMEDLKEKCKSLMFANIGRENICEALVFSFKFNDEEVKNTCFSFLERNFDASLIASDSWVQFAREHPEKERQVILAQALGFRN